MVLLYTPFKVYPNIWGPLRVLTSKLYQHTKFRLASHDLAIERGRYENIDRNERICRCCNGNFVESEYHFLLVCPFYRELRQRYMKPYYCHWPTLNKFEDLMCKRNKNTILNLSKFICFAFKSRQMSNLYSSQFTGIYFVCSSVNLFDISVLFVLTTVYMLL